MKKRKGLTLIELIISLALIGIIAISMLGAFDTSLVNINRAGNRTKDVLDAKAIVDNEIDTVMLQNYDETTVTDSFSIKLPGLVDEENVEGILIDKEYETDNNGKIGIKTFIPITITQSATVSE